MPKRKMIILVSVVILLVAVISVKTFTQGEKPADIYGDIEDLESEYEAVQSTDKPKMIIFTYDADCCPATRQFFDEYNEEVRKIVDQFSNSYSILYINTGVLSQGNYNVMIEIAQQNNVSNLPSISLADGSGGNNRVVEGPFDFNELTALMDEYLTGSNS